MKDGLRHTLVFLILTLLTQVAFADSEVSAQQQNSQPKVDQDPRIAYAIEKLGKTPEIFSDGIVMFRDLKPSFFSKVPVQDVYQFFQDECKKEGDGWSFTTESDYWTEFHPENQDPLKLAEYLTHRGIPPDKAGDAAKAIIYSEGGGFVQFNQKKLLGEAFKEHGKYNELGSPKNAHPFLCIARQNGYDQNIVFAAGFVGEWKSPTTSFFYVPRSFFDAANKSHFDYYGSDDFISDARNRVIPNYEKKAQERAQEVLNYAYSGTGIIQSVYFKPGYREGVLTVWFSNHTKKPVVFGLQSISSVKFGETEYGIAYNSTDGNPSITSENCPLVNDGKDALINPRAECKALIPYIETPGINPRKLPNKTVEMVVLGLPIKLSPVLRGAESR